MNLENLIVIKPSILESNHIDFINKIYYTYISNIKMIILKNKYVRETGFELFEKEWSNYSNDINSILKQLISKPYLIIPFNLEDIVEGKIFILLKLIIKIKNF